MKLKQVGAIKEVFYLEWLANIVVVKKKSGKWRVCVDFTDLNRLASRCHCWPSSDEFLGCLSRLSPNTISLG